MQNQHNYSIEMCYQSGEKFYTGKVVGDTLYKNFKLNKAILWSKQQFGINVEIFDYLQEHGVKNIVYIDTTTKKDAWEISMEDFDANKEMKQFRYGRQYFVGTEHAHKLEEVPYIPFIKNAVQIHEAV
jgi:hypothetical protein